MESESSKNKNKPGVVSVTKSPYEGFKFPEAHELPTSLEVRKMRLECVLAAITTGAREPDTVVETAQKFWDFVQHSE